MPIVGYSRASSAFNPLTVGWTHAYWPEGPEFLALGLTDTAAVATFPDEIGTADFVQSTANLQAAYRTTTGPNSTPCVDFDGSNDYMTSTLATMAQPFTVVMIYMYRNSPQTGKQRPFGSNTGNFAFFDGGDTADGRLRMYAGSVDFSTSVVFSNLTPFMLTCYYNGASSGATYNGSAVASPGGWSIGSNGLTNPNLSDSAAGYSANIDVSFIGLFSGDVTTDPKWAQFKAWVTSHYGITVI